MSRSPAAVRIGRWPLLGAIGAVLLLSTGAGPVSAATLDPPSTYAGVRLSVEEVAGIAHRAGFQTEDQLVAVTAIAIAESSITTQTRNWHPEYGFRPSADVLGVAGPPEARSGDGSQMHSDRGLWQISSHWWPQYTDAVVDDPAQAAAVVYAISSGGSDFLPWDTFRYGAAQRHYDQPYNGWPAVRPIVQRLLGSSSPPTTSITIPAPTTTTTTTVRPTTTTARPATTTTTSAPRVTVPRKLRKPRVGVVTAAGAGFVENGEFTPLPASVPGKKLVAVAGTASGDGAWLATDDGAVVALGDAGFHGSMELVALNRAVVGMSVTPSGQGYWLVAADGGIFSFGDAGFHGSTGSLTLNQPVVGMVGTATGSGYWFVASDGGIFSFGDASFHGSTGSITLNQPVIAMAATPSASGYWLVASDGGIFAFGDAGFFGSTGDRRLGSPVIGLVPGGEDGGYAVVTSDGDVHSFA